jgi:hypothetical protein
MTSMPAWMPAWHSSGEWEGDGFPCLPPMHSACPRFPVDGPDARIKSTQRRRRRQSQCGARMMMQTSIGLSSIERFRIFPPLPSRAPLLNNGALGVLFLAAWELSFRRRAQSVNPHDLDRVSVLKLAAVGIVIQVPLLVVVVGVKSALS